MIVRRTALAVCLATIAGSQPKSPAPLKVEKVIPLAGVRGRIEHMTADPRSGRVFVAATGANSVVVIDSRQGKPLASIPGMAGPRDLLFVSPANRLYAANRDDGTLRAFEGTSYKQLESIILGSNPGALRFDAGERAIWAGYGDGALAMLDLRLRKLAEIKLESHPEAFELDSSTPHLFANLPAARGIAVVDRARKVAARTWPSEAGSNYAMALDRAGRRLFIAARRPAKLVVLDAGTGLRVDSRPTIPDAGNVFFDPSRKRVYVCGEGAVDVVDQKSVNQYELAATIPTPAGARTCLWSAELDRLFVVAPARGTTPAQLIQFTAGEDKPKAQ